MIGSGIRQVLSGYIFVQKFLCLPSHLHSTMSTAANPGDSGTADASFPPGVTALLTNITGSISSVVENKLAQFKRELSLDNSEAIDNAAKKARGDTYEFKKPGNKQQFEHEEKVLDHLEAALDATSKGAIEKAKKSLKQGIALVTHRIKLIKLADKSEFGCGTVNEYLSDE